VLAVAVSTAAGAFEAQPVGWFAAWGLYALYSEAEVDPGLCHEPKHEAQGGQVTPLDADLEASSYHLHRTNAKRLPISHQGVTPAI
jgi:hypothetical protein